MLFIVVLFSLAAVKNPRPSALMTDHLISNSNGHKVYSCNMERSIVAVEENHQGSSTTPAPKSLGSLIKIDSISIDLGIAMEKNEAGKCQHFSIRGYVAEMRKKDKKICSPFASDGNHCNLEEHLPPLFVAKFKWWRCGTCLQDIAATSSSEEMGLLSKCCKSGFISSITCPQMPSHGDTAMVPSDLQQPPTVENCEGKKTDVHTSPNLNGDENYLLCTYRKEDAEVCHMDVNGVEKSSEDDANREISVPTFDLTIYDPCSSKERNTHSTVPIKLKGSGSLDTCETNNEIHDAVVRIPVEICQNISSAESEQRNVVMTCETSEEGCKVDEETGVVESQANKIPSLELEESDKASSESDEILAQDSGLARRKTRKVRLLTELLGGKGNVENDYRRAHVSSCNMILNVSTGIASHSAPQGHGFRSPHRKRKVAIENSDSEPEEDASARLGLQTSFKNAWSKRGIHRNPTLGQKRNKKTQVGNGFFPSVPGDAEINHNKIGDPEKCGAGAAPDDTRFSNSVNDLFRGSGMEPYFRSYMPLEKAGKEASSTKNKDKMVVPGDGQDSFMLRSKNMLGEASIKRTDREFLPSVSEIFNPHSKNDACTKMGLDLSLNSYMAAGRNDNRYAVQAADKNDYLLPQQKGIPSKNHKINDGMFVGESSFSPNSIPDSFMSAGLCRDFGEINPHRIAISRQQQNYSPQLGDESYTLHRKLDLTGSFNRKKTIGVPGRSEIIRIHSDQRADHVYEKGTSDDIPMEIVELMAKNQYERGLYKTERNYCPSEITNNKSNAERMSFPNVHGDGLMRSLQKEFPGMRKHPSTYSTINTKPADPNLAPTKRNPFDFSHLNSHFNMGPLEENPAFTMSDALSQGQQRPSSATQYSAPGLVRNGYFQNQVLEAWQTGLQNKETGNIWSFMTPNHIPFRPNIPQKCSTQSSNIEQHKRTTVRDLDLNLFDLNANANLENQNKTSNNDDTSQRTSTDYPFGRKNRGIELNAKGMGMGSLDPYSNETIPAMQLLSLMDPGMQSSTPFNVDSKRVLEKPFFPCDNHPNFTIDGKPNFFEKPLFKCPYHVKDLSGGVFKASESSRHPSSSSAYYGKNQLSKKYCECSPAVEPYPSLLQNDGNLRNPLFGKCQEEPKRPFYPPTQNRGRRSKKSVLAFNNGEYKQKGIVGASESLTYPFQCQRKDSTVTALKSKLKTDVCRVNRNPADFSVPEAGNKYMIRGEDLRVGKKIHSKGKSGINLDGQKCVRLTKLTRTKEQQP